jgi:hypothetical protein
MKHLTLGDQLEGGGRTSRPDLADQATIGSSHGIITNTTRRLPSRRSDLIWANLQGGTAG